MGKGKKVHLTPLDELHIKLSGYISNILSRDVTTDNIFGYTTKFREEGYSYEDLIDRVSRKYEEKLESLKREYGGCAKGSEIFPMYGILCEWQFMLDVGRDPSFLEWAHNKISNKENKEIVEKAVEIALDKLCDAGLLVPRWTMISKPSKQVKTDRWERRYFSKREIAEPSRKFLDDKTLTQIDVYNKFEDLIRRFDVYDGEIQNQELAIQGSFEYKIPYEKLWQKIQELNDNIGGKGVYEYDEPFVHQLTEKKKKKIGIFGINPGIGMEVPQCKVRHVFLLNKDGETKKVRVIPTVNPKIPVGKCSSDYKFKLCQSGEDIYGEDEICRDCTWFNTTMDVVSDYLDSFKERFNDFEINGYSWNYMTGKYEGTGIEDEISKIIKK